MRTFVLTLLAAGALSALPLYQVTAIGKPVGATQFAPQGMNNLGQVVGFASFPGQTWRATMWSGGQFHDLHVAGASNSIAWAINDSGTTVGYGWDLPGTAGFVWSGVMLQQTLSDFIPTAINNAGLYAGYTTTPYGLMNTGTVGGPLNPITLIGSKTPGGIYAINSSGQMAGTLSFPSNAVFWNDPTHPIELPHGSGEDYGVLNDLNDAGVAVGTRGSIAANSYRAFRYVAGMETILSPLSGHTSSAAFSINEQGWVVGSSTEPGPFFRHRGTVWVDGAPQDLDQFLLTSLNYPLPVRINDQGQILAESGGEYYLLTPTPEPSTGLMIALALGALVGQRLRRR